MPIFFIMLLLDQLNLYHSGFLMMVSTFLNCTLLVFEPPFIFIILNKTDISSQISNLKIPDCRFASSSQCYFVFFVLSLLILNQNLGNTFKPFLQPLLVGQFLKAFFLLIGSSFSIQRGHFKSKQQQWHSRSLWRVKHGGIPIFLYARALTLR